MRTALTIGNTQVRIEVSNAGVGVGRRTIDTSGEETLRGEWRRSAVGIGDYDTLAAYRAAVVALLTNLGLSNAEASDAYWQRITQAQWNNR